MDLDDLQVPQATFSWIDLEEAQKEPGIFTLYSNNSSNNSNNTRFDDDVQLIEDEETVLELLKEPFEIIDEGQVVEAEEGLLLTSCQECGYRPESAKEAMEHMSRSHAKKAAKFECTLCGVKLVHRDSLRKHVHRMHFKAKNALITGVGRQRSEITRFFSKNSDHCKENISNNAPYLKAFRCVLCDMKIFSTYHLQTHTKIHTKEKPLGGRGDDNKCEVCGEKFVNFGGLNGHVERYHMYQCSTCDKHFQSAKSLRRHFNREHGQKTAAAAATQQQQRMKLTDSNRMSIKLPSKCGFCPHPAVFTSEPDFDRHVRDSHPLKCPLCPKMVKFRSSIRKHFKKFHKKFKPNFCQRCASVFLKPYQLESHKRSGKCWKNPVNANNSGEETSDCSSILSTTLELPQDDHHCRQSSSSSSTSIFTCKICQHESPSSLELNSHIAEIHPYQCPLCPDKGYKHVRGLKEHFKPNHAEKHELQVCKMCLKTYADKSEFSRHSAECEQKDPFDERNAFHGFDEDESGAKKRIKSEEEIMLRKQVLFFNVESSFIINFGRKYK